jgi:SAM-dependent methyltransferase
MATIEVLLGTFNGARFLSSQLCSLENQMGGVEWLYRHWSIWRVNVENRKFCREQPDFIPPPLAAMHDAYGSISCRDYWHLGERIAQLVTHMIHKHHSSPRRVLEWGCGPARILRHLPALLAEDTRFFGTDYNEESISWCRRAIKDITFIHNALYPPLPFADGYFDVIYAVSVLTHLSASQQMLGSKSYDEFYILAAA